MSNQSILQENQQGDLARSGKGQSQPKLKATAIAFRFALSGSEVGAAVASGDTLERLDAGWLVCFAETGRRVWVPDWNAKEVLL